VANALDVSAWIEDDFLPRLDKLVENLRVRDEVVFVVHPENFRSGDVVRLGEEDRYWTGEFDEYGNEVFLVHNEAALVQEVGKSLLVQRGYNTNPRRPLRAGEPVIVIGRADG
jgi:hypothetical protein